MGDVRLGAERVAKTWVWAGFVRANGTGAGTVARGRRKGGFFRLRAPDRAYRQDPVHTQAASPRVLHLGCAVRTSLAPTSSKARWKYGVSALQ